MLLSPVNLGHVGRLIRAGWVLAREGVFSGVDPRAVPVEARLPLAVARMIARPNVRGGVARLPAAITRLGPSYIKLGQFLATRPDVVGAAAVKELESLRDRVAPFPQEVAVATVEAAFGKPITALFSEFSQPVAAASIAQVHRARVAGDGREVAVKVARPGVARRFRRDLSDMAFAARVAERWLADARRLKPTEVVDTLARSVTMEMDFRIEAAAASEFADNAAEDPDFRVPSIDWTLTAKDVLTLDWVQGTSLSNIPALEARGVDLADIGRIVIQSFLRHAVRDGFFHADMHQGNLFVDHDGRLVAVDFGIMGRLGAKERRFLAEILYGFITRDYARVAEVHIEAGYVPRKHRVADFAQAIRAIGEPIHSRTADQISMANLLTLLFEITALFDMRTRTELVMLQKTMVVVEGVARSLDPKLNLWATSEPVVRTWIEENLGPAGKLQDLGSGLASLWSASLALPDLMLRGERILGRLEDAAEHGIGLSGETVEGLAQAQMRRIRWLTLALWIIAFVLMFKVVL
ncbi:2-polyprenylphenol 6-hydroxylase [Lichenihabitans sp. Uapishka_5]|uniref:2-polyprenylphenol 6-hydroxylase n=1 Tax=Lichenihabitans sp. Uapishka_5 TaxID=3037302 RepID=UPI0029E7D3C2|nr:2-polyprenylphenol 6-hydroxylase [Lichenihabitans sp. Uapishka_5]MDX7950119.1 2-polyprenylphenol 6-hydroxylase [Lichenihabitans sp. Uapishka_5]